MSVLYLKKVMINHGNTTIEKFLMKTQSFLLKRSVCFQKTWKIFVNFYGAFLSFVEDESHLIASTVLQNFSCFTETKKVVDFFFF